MFPVDFWGWGPDDRFTPFKGHLIHPPCHAMPPLSPRRTPSARREACTHRDSAHPGPPQTRPLCQAPAGPAFWSRQVRAVPGASRLEQTAGGGIECQGRGPPSAPPLCRPALRPRLGGHGAVCAGGRPSPGLLKVVRSHPHRGHPPGSLATQTTSLASLEAWPPRTGPGASCPRGRCWAP